MSRPHSGIAQYRSNAAVHLDWCQANEVSVLGGRWNLEDPITGLLLAAVAQKEGAGPVLSALCSQPWESVTVRSAWWPSALVDLIVNFEVEGAKHMMVLEHKHVYSPSNAPGYRSAEGGRYWQTELMLREIDRVRQARETRILGGPFNMSAEQHLVVLDARGRTMREIFNLMTDDEPHRHEAWSTVSYGEIAQSLRSRYETGPSAALEPLLGQLFASEVQ